MVMGILAPERHKPFVGKSERISQRSEMFLHQPSIEAVVSGGHGRVRRKRNFAGDARHGLIEVHTLFLHAAANSFPHRKSAMPFIQVKHPTPDAPATQRSKATH